MSESHKNFLVYIICLKFRRGGVREKKNTIEADENSESDGFKALMLEGRKEVLNANCIYLIKVSFPSFLLLICLSFLSFSFPY